MGRLVLWFFIGVIVWSVTACGSSSGARVGEDRRLNGGESMVVVVGATEAALDAAGRAAGNPAAQRALVASRAVFLVPAGSRVRILDATLSKWRVQVEVLDGASVGVVGWVPSERLSR
jgi:hypothetical protein